MRLRREFRAGRARRRASCGRARLVPAGRRAWWRRDGLWGWLRASDLRGRRAAWRRRRRGCWRSGRRGRRCRCRCRVRARRWRRGCGFRRSSGAARRRGGVRGRASRGARRRSPGRVRRQALGEGEGDFFDQAARVDEDQRGAVCERGARGVVKDLLPHRVGGDRTEFVGRDFDCKIERRVEVDDAGGGRKIGLRSSRGSAIIGYICQQKAIWGTLVACGHRRML